MATQKDPLFASIKSKRTSRMTTPAAPAANLHAFTQTIVDRIETLPVQALKAHPRRTRTHDEKQIAVMMGAFNEFGFINPLIIDEKNIVLAGDARLEAARRLGISALPVVRIDHLSEAEKRAYKIADNRIAELAGWDIGELSIELNELIDIGFNMDAIGFDTPVIDLLLSQASEQVRDEPDPADAIPQLQPDAAVSRAGDIWQLGTHLVGCGSALDEKFLAQLMGGDQARMILTDAPYNCAIDGFVGGLGKVKHREFAMASGEMSKQEFLSFLTTASANAAHYLVDGGLLCGFMDWRQLGTYMAALDAAGLSQINLCVWDKGTGGMGSLYRSQHELCLIYKKGKVPHTNNVELGRHGRYRTNVWSHPGMSSFGRSRDEALKLHPTVKPVGLLIEAIKDVTHPGDIVLDTFLGSGSTLIAAEKCKRVCRGVEIDPLYVDTIVRRFEALTGIEAIHLMTGESFVETAAERASAEASPSEQPVTDVAASQTPNVSLEHVRRRTRAPSAVKDENGSVVDVPAREVIHV